MLKPVRIAEPTFAPVSLATAKAFMRVEHDAEDALISQLIDKATRELDGYDGLLNIAFCTQAWRINLDQWPRPAARLRLSPIQSITSIKFWDTAGVQQTLASSSYSMIEDEISPLVQWAGDFTYPPLATRPDAIEVIFVAGHTEGQVPSDLMDIVMRRVTTAYELRENAIVGESIATFPAGENIAALKRRIF